MKIKLSILKFYIIAGEASGDLHASNLMKALIHLKPESDFRYWGGDKMSSVFGSPVKHIKDLAFMGFIEVVANIKTISKNISFCKKDILSYKPDALILVDYPGFNLRIAKFAKEHQIPVHYYISPQVWAWKQNRVFKIKKCVDEMYCILPFEKDFYKKFDMSVHYVGHPLIDAITNYKSTAPNKLDFTKKNNLSDQKIIAILPGSRKQEIKIKLPIMLAASKKFVSYQIIIAGAPNLSQEFYQEIAQDQKIVVVHNQTYALLNHAFMAMVTSGTATLETALFHVPEVVCYKGSSISYQIAKRLIKVKFISLVNLIMDKLVVTELIQNELTAEALYQELNYFKDENSEKRLNLIKEYQALEVKLGGGGASEKVAQLVIDSLRKIKS